MVSRLAPRFRGGFSLGFAMNLVLHNQQQTMSSREIAALCDKDISHVHRDIRVMLCQLKDDPDLYHLKESKDSRGYVQEYFLPKSLTITVVMGYSIPLRKRVIDRWQELESKVANAFKVPSTLSEALRLAADQQEAIEAQQARLAVAEPKAEAFDELSSLDGLMNRRQAAKSLGVTGHQLKTALLDKGWVFRKNGSGIECYSSAIRSGVVAQKNMVFGNYRTVSQVLITNKGHALLKLHFVQNKSQQNLNLGARK